MFVAILTRRHQPIRKCLRVEHGPQIHFRQPLSTTARKNPNVLPNDAVKWLCLLTASALYSEGLGFHSRTADQISWLGSIGLLFLSRFLTAQEIRAKFLSVTRMCIFQLGAGIATGWKVRVSKPSKQCFLILQNVHTGPESYPATKSLDSFVSVSGPDDIFTTLLHPLQRLRMSGCVLLPPSVCLRDVDISSRLHK